MASRPDAALPLLRALAASAPPAPARPDVHAALRTRLREQRRAFGALRALRDQANATGLALDTLSMGMSGDFEAAIAEGATIVRIGTALFGAASLSRMPRHVESQLASHRIHRRRQHGPRPHRWPAGPGRHCVATSPLPNPTSPRAPRLVRDFGVTVTADNAAAVAGARVVILAVKPQLMADVARALAPALQAARPLVISVAAGIRADRLQHWLGPDIPVVRSMPNRPALIGAGATGLYASAALSAEDRALAQQVLASTGLCVWVRSEGDIDVVTALSGSGPAYFFRLAELMAEAGVAQGLEPHVAQQLAAQTLAGAGQLVAAEAGAGSGAHARRGHLEGRHHGGRAGPLRGAGIRPAGGRRDGRCRAAQP